MLSGRRNLSRRLHVACRNIGVGVSGQQWESLMPYRRGGFALTPPSVFIFLVSLALALLAMLVRYAHAPVPIINASHVFDVLAIAYVVLTIGVLFRRV
jgi:hypothetical protein